MTLIVCNADGESVRLNEQPLARGGEGAVHEVLQYPGVVVKLYAPEVLAKRGTSLRDKIEAIVQEQALAQFKQHPSLAWPRFSVFDEKGHWRGYAMRKVAGKPLTLMAHAKAYQNHFPNLDRPLLVDYLVDLLRVVQQLHQAGVCLGDYNPNNFLCDTTQPKVFLIDCDSWQVQAAGKRFACPVAAPDMLAPELLGKDLVRVKRTPESEYFSLSILLFKVLMLGRHPYDVIGGSSPVENIRRGYFPYGIGAGGIPKGPWYNIWSHMPYQLKAQFVRTFRDGPQNPSARTSVAEWLKQLRVYRYGINMGWHATQICPPAPKSSEYRGRQSISQPIAS